MIVQAWSGTEWKASLCARQNPPRGNTDRPHTRRRRAGRLASHRAPARARLRRRRRRPPADIGALREPRAAPGPDHADAGRPPRPALARPGPRALPADRGLQPRLAVVRADVVGA